MERGVFPSIDLLKEYELVEYEGLVSACVKGDLKQLDLTLD